jgi:ferric-chelate reductase (NADPH)
MSRLTERLSGATTRILRKAEVDTVIELSDHFRHIDLRGEGLRGASWAAGHKVQVRMDGFTTRTFTPVSWNAEDGATAIVAFVHGHGPGSDWAEALKPGQDCQLLGPRKSLNLDDIRGEPIFVGDETSFALALAWRVAHPERPRALHIFEVDDRDESADVLDRLGVLGVRLVVKDENRHLGELAAVVRDAARADARATLVLSGKAQTIGVMRATLKSAGIVGRDIRVKAYWDENRKGLD